jgi:anti-sigma factor RsiW
MDCPRAELEDDRPLRRNLDRPVGIKAVKPPSYSVPSETPQITCRRFVKSLSAWQDGELAGGARASFEKHRAECARCARYAWAFQATIALVKSTLAGAGEHVQLPEDLAQAILTACRETN